MFVHVERELIHGFRRAGRKKPAILQLLDPQKAPAKRIASESSTGERGASG
jgi:hypothetical protein